eukprot:364081-Chlamydomonas_euryale.AAC.12
MSYAASSCRQQWALPPAMGVAASNGRCRQQWALPPAMGVAASNGRLAASNGRLAGDKSPSHSTSTVVVSVDWAQAPPSVPLAVSRVVPFWMIFGANAYNSAGLAPLRLKHAAFPFCLCDQEGRGGKGRRDDGRKKQERKERKREGGGKGGREYDGREKQERKERGREEVRRNGGRMTGEKIKKGRKEGGREGGREA